MEQDPLDSLLRVLGSGPEQAGHAYRALHARMVRFFRLHRVADPEVLADKAMDRLARRVAAEDSEEIGSPQAFALGIARHLVQEELRSRLREDQVALEWSSLQPAADEEQEFLLQAVDHCLGGMRADQQRLLRSYYEWSGRKKIEHHRKLAEELGLTMNALRNRLMRARIELDRCVRLRSRDVTQQRDTKTWKDGVS